MEETLSDFNEYFQMLDTFLDETAFRTTVVANPDAEYAFDYKLTVEGEQIDGSAVSHVLYYSEERVDVRPDDRDEQIEAYRLTGVMMMEDVAYDMSGYRSVVTESDRDETESSESLWIRATDPADSSNYVQMDLESEEEQEHNETESEREYVYSVYQNGRRVEQTRVNFESETENGANETEYTLSILKGGVSSYFEVERAERVSGAVRIYVNYRNADGESGRFYVTQTADGMYDYIFVDGAFNGGHIEFDDYDD